MKDELNAQIDAFQEKYDYNMDYAREVVAIDPELYVRFFQATQLARYDGGLPSAAHWAVQTLGIMAGDCGPCVQLSVRLGEEAGVSEDVIQGVLKGDLEVLSGETRLCAEFAQALLTRSPSLPKLRDEVVTRLGKEAAVAVAFGLITSYMYPTLKYALGHGHTCSPVVLSGRRVAVDNSMLRFTAAE